ncbi:uncharacterized protein LOC101861720 [Aplysia californica]|uniref:Uncharacterized protein LOC101861720 n=1 Tax=Aplysia californica TaxID=6500 RepID=A0ABM0JJE0_APLCA|nr:uncharacterized protein LOC101861720 [Aplysia californica]
MEDSKNKDPPKTCTRGTHEVEEQCAEAGGPLTSYTGCTKNPGHPQFIPVYEFNTDHVRSWTPDEGHQTADEIAGAVKCFAETVVRIRVPLISDQRPDTWADGRGYPFADRKGWRLNIAGSGFVVKVYGQHDGLEGPCKCDNCPKGTAEENKYWKILVVTARHVVYGDNEARACEVVFFDDQSDGSGSVTLTGGGAVEGGDTEEDGCELAWYTHNRKLAHRLKNLCNRRSEMLFRWFEETRVVVRSPRGKKRRLDVSPRSVSPATAVVISHPHGRMKYISLGNSDPDSLSDVKPYPFTYTVATCPGSSGGLVLPLGTHYYSFWFKPHSFSLSGNHGRSAGGFFYYC